MKRVNLNTAGYDELKALPEIDDVLASRILYHREECGPFESVDELPRVFGISHIITERLRERVCVRDEEGEGPTPEPAPPDPTA